MATPETASLDSVVDRSGAALPRRSIIDTWIEVVADTGGLVQAEARLARIETGENFKYIGRELAVVAAGGVLLSVALVFLTVAAVVGLAVFVGMLAALLIVAAVCVLAGILLIRGGVHGLSVAHLLPEQSLGRMSRDLGKISERAAPVEPIAKVVADLEQAGT